jgi:hypothetical protein
MPVDIQSYIKELASTKLVIGGIYDVNAVHLSISNIDVISDHFYGARHLVTATFVQAPN